MLWYWEQSTGRHSGEAANVANECKLDTLLSDWVQTHSKISLLGAPAEIVQLTYVQSTSTFSIFATTAAVQPDSIKFKWMALATRRVMVHVFIPNRHRPVSNISTTRQCTLNLEFILIGSLQCFLLRFVKKKLCCTFHWPVSQKHVLSLLFTSEWQITS